MSTRPDPLSARAVQGPDRVNYAQGVLLDALDFSDEQTYHRGRLARALKYLFGTGTVAGLAVTWRPATQEILIAPGLALDPLGRLIEVPRTFCLRLRNWFAGQRAADLRDAWIAEGGGQAVVVADVFVRFVVCERGKTPAFATGPFDALDAVTPARLRDGHELALVPRPEAGERRRAIADGDPTPPVIPRPGAADRLLDILTGAGTPAQRLAGVHADILAGWRDGTDAWQDDRPGRLPEHLPLRTLGDEDDPTAVGRDTTSVLLARLTIPIDPPPATPPDAPPRDRGEAPAIDNDLRRFVYAPGILTRPLLPETP